MIIYGLFDPITKQLRYVGFTSKSLDFRLKGHMCDSSNTHKVKWIKSLRKKGFKPEIVILQETNEQERVFDEQWSIAYYKSIGCNLTNATIGGDGVLGRKYTDAQRKHMSEIKKNISPETRKLIGEANKRRSNWKQNLDLMNRNSAKVNMVKKRKLTDEQSEEAKQLHVNGMSFSKIGFLYGVTGASIWQMIHGKLKYQISHEKTQAAII